MAQVDRGLETREKQLLQAIEQLTKEHGAQSETVAIMRSRLDEVQAEIRSDAGDVNVIESTEIEDSPATHCDARFVKMKLPQAKDATRMFVLIGGILIFAMGGLSTMFVLMIALGFGKTL